MLESEEGATLELPAFLARLRRCQGCPHAQASDPLVRLLVGRSREAARAYRKLGGLEVAYEVRGAGEPTLVFVHGWMCERAHWRDALAAFEDEHRVVALVGPGRSTVAAEGDLPRAHRVVVVAQVEQQRSVFQLDHLALVHLPVGCRAAELPGAS